MHKSPQPQRRSTHLRRQTDEEPSTDDWSDNRKYGIVIDAGSSGSRVYVYSWKDHEYMRSLLPPDQLRGRIPIVERGDKLGLKWTRREEPGISSYGSRPQEVGEHLDVLLQFAGEVVPTESHSSTPVFLMATAGMRLLPEDERSAVLNATCSHIRENYSFFISDCDTHVRVIPGELEGIYGWVAVNYLMGGFDASIQEALDRPNKFSSGEQHHTFGFLDMGGASAQIAFEPEHHQKEEHSSDLAKISLNTLDGERARYDVFVTTFLGYGSNEARRRYLEARVKDKYKSAKGNSILDEHHALHLDDPCLPYNLTLIDAHSTSVTLTLHGTGSFSECIEMTTPLLNKDAECPMQPCMFNGVHTPHIDWSVNKFVGISEYWYSSHDILGLGGVYDFAEYQQKATEYCAKDWSVFLEEHKELDQADLGHHQMQCFKSAWIVNVLHNGIEIPRIMDPGHGEAVNDQQLLEQSIESIESKNWNPPFQSIDTINDIQVSWTLGAMLLYATNQIPLANPSNPHFSGHNTDDEAYHQIADGVELPQPHSPYSENTPEPEDHWSSKLQTNYMTLVIVILIILFLWYIYSKTLRKRRSADEGRWDGANGGLLGVNADSNASIFAFSHPLSLASRFSVALSRSTLRLRHWLSKMLFHSRPSSAAVLDMDTFGESNDSVSIHILPNSGSNSPSTRVGGALGPSSRSQSFVSGKYWSKKRYSGDSHASLFPPNLADGKYRGLPGDHGLPLRSSSSALNLANRANVSANNSGDIH